MAGLLHVVEVGLLPPHVVVVAVAVMVVKVSVPHPPPFCRFDFHNFAIAPGTLGMDLDIVVGV